MHIHLSVDDHTGASEPHAAGTSTGRTSTRCVCSAVRRADRALNRLYDDALRPSGLATTQYALLSILANAGAPLSHRQLAEIQGMAGTTLSRTLKPLVRDGLVDIEPGEDRRTRYVLITANGAAALERARPLWRAAQQRIVDDLGAERVDRLLEELRDLTARVRE